MIEDKTYCGSVTIVGRPNVGKSTLLNRLLRQKVSITSRKPHTTRYCISGIHTEGKYQAIYIDTPGLHMEAKCEINRAMNQTASRSINNAELIIFVVEGIRWTLNDKMILKKLRDSNVPVILAVNKVDNIHRKNHLLPHLKFLNNQMHFLDIVPISAETGMNIDTIKLIVHNQLSEAYHCFPETYMNNYSHRFMASEIIREKLMRFLNAELPYSIVVKIENFQKKEEGSYTISSLLVVEREGHKKIVIGKNGFKIKKIGIEARKDIQKMLEAPIHLKLWVKVKFRFADIDVESIFRSLNYVKA